MTRQNISIKCKNPDVLIGTEVTVDVNIGGKRVRIKAVVQGWHRTDTSRNGMRYVGFGLYHSNIALDLAGGHTAYVTITTEGTF